MIQFIVMPSIKEIKDFVVGKKSVINITAFSETTREGIQKAYIPKFLYKPPFGYPRFANMGYVRYLSQTPYVEMCISTIIDNIRGVEWDIVPTDGMEDQSDVAEVEHIRTFFENPNTNDESFDDVFVEMPVRDILEVNAGVLNKIFNLKEDMVEVVARDGATFTKNPDIHGMYTNREEILLPKTIVQSANEVVNPFQQMSQYVVREQAAYFQYGWIAGPVPVPFGKREIIWLERMKRTDDHYGYSPVQILAKNLQMLLYMIESDLEYYNDNNVPKGIIGLEDSDDDEVEAFKDQWTELQRKKDEFGNWKKMMHKVPFINKKPIFTRIEFSASELQIIEKQKWYTKMVWACFGVTPTELGYTEDAKGVANQIVQSKVFRKKAINPILRLLESKYNKNIVSEFEYWGFITTEQGKKIRVPKYKFVFKVFDTDEEKAKYELYKLQVEAGLKTINEVRITEGEEEVEWGDEPPKNWMAAQNSTNFYGNQDDYQNRQNSAQDTDDDMDEPGTNDPRKPKEPGSEKKSKAQPPSSPLILRENEKPTDYKKLEKAITFVLKKQEDNIKTLLEGEVQKSTIKEIKDINSVIDKIQRLLAFTGLNEITAAIIKNNYLKGWEEAEKALNMNFMPETHAMEYLIDYTFENIKGMEKDIADKLRQELKRAYMSGEGLEKVKERVSKVFDVGENRAEMIARTETNRASNFGKFHAYQKANVPGKKKWITHFDQRTSELCKRLDNQVVGLDENFKDPKGDFEGPVPPAHVNCRSGWAFVMEE